MSTPSLKALQKIIPLLRDSKPLMLMDYDLALLLIEAYGNIPSDRAFNEIKNHLLNYGVLMHPLPNSKALMCLIGSRQLSSAEIACKIDPFCYISHLSAMEHYSLTDRMPSTVYLSTPARINWTKEATLKMRKDLGVHFEGYQQTNLPKIKPIKLETIQKRPLQVSHITKHHGAFIHVEDKCVRVSSLGRTFLDMLREPSRCGGIRHVKEQFVTHAETYLPLILDEFDQHGSNLDKVRAGYLMEELAGIESPRIENWVQFAKRGGSSKLDASVPYEPVWSEKWKLSLNA